MGSIVSSIVTGITFFCCTAACSVCTSCLGNDKSSSDPPSMTSGRARSVFLLLLSVLISFGYQYGIGPWLSEGNLANITSIGKYLIEGWNKGCENFETETIQEACRGNSGVYRVSFSTTLFFILSGCAALTRPSFNREGWCVKYMLYLLFVGAMIFVPSDPLFLSIYMQIARVGAAFFIIIQQIMLVNIAYNWNESWVMKADKANSENEGSGKLWLTSILGACAILFIGSFTVIGFMYHHFQGCNINMAFISITLLLIIFTTALQLTGEESSLLTSGLVSAWTTYLALSAVSKNPNGDCNPRLGKEDAQGILLGLGVTCISLAYVGFSYTSNSTLSNSKFQKESENEPSKHVTGVVTNDDDKYGATDESGGEYKNGAISGDGANEIRDDGPVSETWKLDATLGLISCFIAMVLTGWGEISADGNAANPDKGKVSMWMIISAQWFCFFLYIWTITAPRLFPDRDFS